MNVWNILKISSGVQRQALREYAFKSDLKIKWVRPEKISCIKPEKSGDLSPLPPVDAKELILDYKNSKELQTADAVVRSRFELANNRNSLTSEYYKINLMKEVQRHPLDFTSMETKLARMTAMIRRYQQHMEKFPRDVRIKVMLKEKIDRRKKFLKYLRRWDYRRFEYMLEKLDLVYKPPPTEFHWITRKESLQKLTNLHCEKIKEERLAAYRKELEDQQIPFLQRAIKDLEFVRSEQKDLEIPVTVDETISVMQKELEQLKEVRGLVDAAINANKQKL